MSGDINIPPETEREQLQEDIERLQLVLQADDELHSEDSDNETPLQIDTEYEGASDKPESSSSQKKLDEDLEVIQFNEEAELPVNTETALALNRAYQELLLDSLRKIEVVLTENRDKQNSLESELAEHGGRPERTYITSPTKKTNISLFAMPYFKNATGKNPPLNVDVQMKVMLDERKQDIKPPAIWTSSQRNILLDAIRQDSLEQILRPLMNRKELEMERLMGLQKEHQTSERVECQNRIEEIDKEMEEAERIPSEELLKYVNEDKIDWLKISNMVFEGKRDLLECQALWKNAMRPSINKDKWSKAEEAKLTALTERYQMRQWNKIAECLGTNRTAFQCLQYYQQNLNDTDSKREWTEEEDYLLAEVIESCKQGNRISWNQVSYYIEGRSASQCIQRWHQIDPVIKRGKWASEEDCILLAAVKLHGEGNWSKIQQHIQGRNASQCRDRYVNSLDPKLRPPKTWSYDEDKKLIKLVNQHGGSSKCSWAKVANGLEGRTDNMVMCRFRRLMDWKKKCDWLETKSDEAKEALGLVNIRASKRRIAENTYGKYETLDRNEAVAYRLAEFNSGVHREDYLKQLEDKYNGELVVPRPPLLYRYNPRSLQKVWERKEQLQKLIEAHICQIRNDKNTKAHDIATIPEKTGELFGSFSMMSQRQKDKLKTFLMGKQASDISVRDVLNVTGKICKRGRAALTEKRQKRMKTENDLDRKVKNIIQWKSYRAITNRISKGRPKKFNLFKPRKRTNQYVEEYENVEEMTKTTSNLLLSALNVNGKKALEKYKTLSQTVRQNKYVRKDIDLLTKVIDNKASQTVTHSPVIHGTVQNTNKELSRSGMNNPPAATLSNIVHVPLQNGNEEISSSGRNNTQTVIQSDVVHDNMQNQNGQVSVPRGSNLGNQSGRISAATSERVSVNNVSESEMTVENNSGSQENVNMSAATSESISMSNVLESEMTVENNKGTLENVNMSAHTFTCTGEKISTNIVTTSEMIESSNFVTTASPCGTGVVPISSGTLNSSDPIPLTSTGTCSISSGEGSISVTGLLSNIPVDSSVLNSDTVTVPVGSETLNNNDPVPNTLTGSVSQRNGSISVIGSLTTIPVNSNMLNSDTVTAPVSSETLNNNDPLPVTSTGSISPGKRSISVTGSLTTIPVDSHMLNSDTVTVPVSSTSVCVSEPASEVGNPVIEITPVTSSGIQLVINKPALKPLPFLPPNLTTLRGFEWLLMQRKLLIAKAGSKYNGFFYKQLASEQQMVTGSDRGQFNVDLNSVMKNIDQKAGSVALKGKRAISGKFGKVEDPNIPRQKGPDSTRDPLKNVRQTAEYELLKSRFQSIFTWPALLATTVPEPESTAPETNSNEKIFDDQSKEMEDSGQQTKKKKYPCAHTKNFYKRSMKGDKWRKEVTNKIVETRRKNRIARLMGKPVETVKKSPKRKNKWLERKEIRTSTRIQERKNVEELMKTMKERDEEKLEQKKPAKKVQSRNRNHMFKLDHALYKGMKEKSIPVNNMEYTPVVDDTVIEIVSDAPQQVEQEQIPYSDTVIEIVTDSDLVDQGQGQGQYLNENLPIQMCSFEPLTNDNVETISSNNTVHLNSNENDIATVTLSANGFLTSPDDIVMATPIGHIDEETGTLKPHTSESGAYPVALVVNQTATLNTNNS